MRHALIFISLCFILSCAPFYECRKGILYMVDRVAGSRVILDKSDEPIKCLETSNAKP